MSYQGKKVKLQTINILLVLVLIHLPKISQFPTIYLDTFFRLPVFLMQKEKERVATGTYEFGLISLYCRQKLPFDASPMCLTDL